MELWKRVRVSLREGLQTYKIRRQDMSPRHRAWVRMVAILVILYVVLSYFTVFTN